MKQTKLRIVLFAITHVLRGAIKKHGTVRKHVGQRRAVVQIKLKDDSIGRWYEISSSGVKSTAGIHPKPDVLMVFKDLDTALTFLDPKVSQAEIIHAAKNFRVMVLGPAEAPLALVRGRYRFRLLVKTEREIDIQSYLRDWLARGPKPRGNLRVGIDVDPKNPKVMELLDTVKAREYEGFSYDGAEASFELMARRALETVPEYFKLASFRVLDERRWNAKGEIITLSAAGSTDPENAPLTYQWFVNGELRGDERTLTLSSLLPTTYDVLLTVNDNAPNSSCTEATARQKVRSRRSMPSSEPRVTSACAGAMP